MGTFQVIKACERGIERRLIEASRQLPRNDVVAGQGIVPRRPSGPRALGPVLRIMAFSERSWNERS
jgi:hypothetical protein